MARDERSDRVEQRGPQPGCGAYGDERVVATWAGPPPLVRDPPLAETGRTVDARSRRAGSVPAQALAQRIDQAEPARIAGAGPVNRDFTAPPRTG